ncbi:hypothetical protein D3C76_1732370 [compost metagenome]
MLVVAQARDGLEHAAQQQADQRREKEQAEEQQGRQQVAAAAPAFTQGWRVLHRCSLGAGRSAGRGLQGIDGDFHLTSHSFQRVAMAGPFLAQ